MKSISIIPFYRKSKEHILPVSIDSFGKGKEAEYHLLSTYVQSAVLYSLIVLSLKSSSESGLILLQVLLILSGNSQIQVCPTLKPFSFHYTFTKSQNDHSNSPNLNFSSKTKQINKSS